MTEGPLGLQGSASIFHFIAGGPSGRGITFWAILLYCSPIVLALAGCSVLIGTSVKKKLILSRLSPTLSAGWKDMIVLMIFEAFAITGSLIFTVYALEEWLEIGSTYHGDAWMAVFLLGTAFLNPLLMIIPHLRLLSLQSGDNRMARFSMGRVVRAFQLGLISPCVFALAVLGFLLALSR